MSKSALILVAAVLIGSAGAALADNLPITDESRYSPTQFILHTMPGRSAVVGVATAGGGASALQAGRTYRTPASAEVLWMQRPTDMNGANR